MITRGALLICLAVAGCTGNDEPGAWQLDGATMGTSFGVTIVTVAGDRARPPDSLRVEVTGLLATVEQSMSTYLIDSDVSRFNASTSTGWFPVSAMVCAAVEESLALSDLTGGAFDISVGPLVDLWGFGPEPSRSEPPDDALVAAARDRVGYRRLAADCSRPALKKSRADVRIDLSAYAKGFAVDRVAELLEAEGITDYMIDIGGELRMRGHNAQRGAWRVAIESPSRSGQRVHRVITLTDAAMATSGDYRNYFEFAERRYSHTIDPRTGEPVAHDLSAVTVVSDEAAFADAMATALLVLGPDAGMELAEREQLATLFQRRVGDRFVEQASTGFRRFAGPAGRRAPE